MVSMITVLTMLGIMLGVAVLIVVLSVMTGFDDMHKEHMIQLDSHLQISLGGGGGFMPEPVMEQLKNIPEIKAAAPSIQGFVMMMRNGRAVTGILRGIDPEFEKGISDLGACLVDGVLPTDYDTVVVGERLAMQLGTHVGDTLMVYSPQCFVGQDELRMPAELTVSGIFSVGMYDVDSQFMMTSLSSARDVFAMDQGVQTLRIMTHDPFAVKETGIKINRHLADASVLQPRLNWFRYLRIRSWIDIHQVMLSTLAMEKNMMFILLCGISLVATMSITNALITLCVQKTHEIGLLKALGFSDIKVVGVFFFLGAIQGAFGCFLGMGMGFWISENLDLVLNLLRMFNPNLMPAQLYQFAQMPSRTTMGDILSVCGIVMLFSTLSGVVPAIRAAQLEPAEALRNE